MKKIPTLFERVFEGRRVTTIKPTAKSGLEWVLDGGGEATVKYDGACCAVIGGKFYKRYDAKRGRKPPFGAIACCEPDPVTGHWPHWVPVDFDGSADKWFVHAYRNTPDIEDGTYEAIGPHFQGNPYGLERDILQRHGVEVIDLPRTFEGIRDFLRDHHMEGIVFWRDGEPQCKIKRSDFGLKWPCGSDSE